MQDKNRTKMQRRDKGAKPPRQITELDTSKTERTGAEEALQYRHKFENTITSISTDFINLPPDGTDAQIDLALQKIGEFTSVDRSYVFLFKDGITKMDNTHEWCREGIEPQIQRLKNLCIDDFYVTRELLKKAKVVHVPRVADLGPEAGADRAEFESEGIESLIAVPLVCGESLIGFLGFDSVHAERSWSEDDLSLIKIVGEIFANALIRKWAEEELAREHNLLRVLVDNLPDRIFVKDADSTFVFANIGCGRHLGADDPQAVIGKTTFDFLPPEAAEESHTQEREIMRTGEGIINEEVCRKNASGQMQCYLSTKVPWRDENGNVIGIVGLNRDITERKRAEETIRLERDKLKGLFEGLACAEIGIDVVGTDYKVHLQNSILKQRFGDLTGKLCYEEYMGLKEPCQFCPMIKAVRNNKVESVELTAKDGRDYELLSAPLPNPDGMVDKAIEVVRDITERKRAEEALRKSESEKRLILDSLSELIIYQDKNLRVVWANKAAGESVGLSPDKLVGGRCYEIWHQRNEPCVDCPVKKSIETGQPHEKEMSTPDGRIWCVRGYPVRGQNGDVIGVVEVVLNITVRKRSEEEIVKARKQAEQYLDIAGVMLAIVNADENITMINKRGSEILGYKEQGLIGKNWFDTLVPKRIRGEIRGIFNKLMAGDIEPVEYYENPLLTKDGEERLVAFHNTVIRNPNGEVVGVLLSGEDITERRRAEATARDVQEKLIEQQRHEKQHVEAELTRTREELIRKTRLATIGQVSASIAHELRNPLGAVGNAAYLLKHHLSKDESKLIEYTDIIKHEVLKANQIITNLLAMVRARPPRKQAVDLGQVIKNAKQAQESKRILYRISMAPDPFIVQADQDQLQQVIDNILRNALYAMRGRGSFFVEATRDSNHDTIVFRDTGPGFAPEVKDNFFEPLITTRASGTGLGLTICRQIVEKHGGTIEAYEHKERGAVIQIRLPRR